MSYAHQKSESPAPPVDNSQVLQDSAVDRPPRPINSDPQSSQQGPVYQQHLRHPPTRHTTWDDYHPPGEKDVEGPYIPPLVLNPESWAPWHPAPGKTESNPAASTFTPWTSQPAQNAGYGSYPAPPMVPQPTSYQNPWFHPPAVSGPAQPNHVAFASYAPQFIPPVSTQTANLPFVRLTVPAESEMESPSQQPVPAPLDQYYSAPYHSRPSTPPFYRRPPKKKLSYDDIPVVLDNNLGWSAAHHAPYVPHYIPPASPGYSPVSPKYSPTLPQPPGGFGTVPNHPPAVPPAWTYPPHVPAIPQLTTHAKAATPTTFSIVLSSLLRFTHPLAKVIYTPLLLNIPSLYRSRVFKVFLEADLGLSQLRNMVVKLASRGKMNKAMMLRVGVGMGADAFNIKGLYAQPYYSGGPAAAPSPWLQSLPPEYEELQKTWDNFIDSLLEEWKTLGVISALVLSAILTVLQIEDAASDYVTRYIALLSLICALVSLVYGCIYIVRFGTMRKPHKAAEWALEAQQRTTDPWWNAWIMLAMPAVWQTWSLILFITSIMTYIWRTSVTIPETVQAPSDGTLLGLRILLSSFLLLGFVQGLAIVKTLMRYGSAMDRSWEEKINKLILETALPAHGGFASGASRGTAWGEQKSRRRTQRPGTTYNDSRLRAPDYPSWRPSDSRATGYAPWEPSALQPPPWVSGSSGAAKQDLVGGYPAFEADQGPSMYGRPMENSEFARTGRLSPSIGGKRRRKVREETRRQRRMHSSDSDWEEDIASRTPDDPDLSRSGDLRRSTRRQRQESSGERSIHDGQGLDKEGEKVEPAGSGSDATRQRMESTSAAFDGGPVRRSPVGSPSYD